GNEDHPVRQIERALEPSPDIVGQTQLAVVELDGGAVEDAEHDAFAVQRWHGRYAKIDVMPADREPDAAILRQPALGDIQPGHDLDAGYDRRLQACRRRLDLVQYAVVAVANAQPVLERFDVHVGSTRFNGPGDQLIDQA